MSYGKIAAVSLMAVGLLSSQAFADGDATKGKAVFARCAICHNVEKDGGNGVGPNLFGIAGRKSATAEGFNYSGPMKAANLTWTDENLAKYIAGPAKLVPGNKMAFGGIAQKSQIADVIAYLHTLK
ncbi:MAG TPA: cytochrome c family protein [Rhizomicrobium sp.]|jgi:cytochrome c